MPGLGGVHVIVASMTSTSLGASNSWVALVSVGNPWVGPTKSFVAPGPIVPENVSLFPVSVSWQSPNS